MNKKLLWAALLLPFCMNSCKDDLVENIKVEKIEVDHKIEKVTPPSSTLSAPDKRKDRDWETSTTS
ncbi:hypothetical protein ABIE26_003974 [Pedobacter africanus]|uniref:Uncharacterized protein n=1 Tax=Pedobacter africanus TaxID=151894 RepID=A0ACC6L0W9_9SPHI|nr:hypothetical protein [Pedobacter africanus]MDR6785275.1 hypothetical protein [Pedobacter africanus]